MKYIENTRGIMYAPLVCCNLFGISDAAATTVSGVVGAGANIASSVITNNANKDIAEITNEANKDIHESDNAFNAAEAEKARQFNAQEAEKARQWSSEQEVMKRRAEAGINIASDGAFSTTSAPSASSPSASSASPIPMQSPVLQAPDLADGVRAMVELAKAPSEIDKTKANTKESEANVSLIQNKVKESSLMQEYQAIQNKWTDKQMNWALKELISKVKHNDSDTMRINAIVDKTREETLQIIGQSYFALSEHNRQDTRLDLDIKRLETDLFGLISDLEMRAEQLETQWRNEHYRMSFNFGERINDIMRGQDTEGVTTASKIFGSFSANVKGFFGLSGGAESSNSSTNQILRFGETSRVNQMQNHDYLTKALECLTCINILKNEHNSLDIKKRALKKLYNVRTSVTDYITFRNQIKLLLPTEDTSFRSSM